VNSPGREGEECLARGWTSLVEGTWTDDDSSFTVGVAEPTSGSISTLTGTFGDDRAELPPTSLSFLVMGSPVTGEISFDLAGVGP